MDNEILVIGEFEYELTRGVINELLSINWKKQKKLTLYICSDGGTLRDCFAIIDIVNRIKETFNVKVTTIGLGEVASAGFFTLLLGDKRILAENARIYVHEHMVSEEPTQTYNERVKILKTSEKKVYEMYLKYTRERLKITEKQAKKLLKKNKWLTSEEIKQYNIAERDINGY